MNPALQVAIASFSIFSAVLSSIVLYIVADLKADIRELRAALGIGPAAKEAAHAR